MFGRPSPRAKRPYQRDESCREALPDDTRSGLESLPEGWEWSGGPYKGSGVAGRQSRRALSGCEASQRSRSGGKAIPEGR